MSANEILVNANTIAADINFVKLDKLLRKFNIFHATDMKHREIKHTKFLAFLLDPNESHGLGGKFLQEFLRYISSQKEIKDIPLLDLHFSLATVDSEFKLDGGAIDILITIPSYSGKKYIIGVENKLNAKQGDNQLKTYGDALKKKFPDPDNQRYHYYLTMYGENSNDPEWTDITFQNHVTPIIEEMLETSCEVMSDYFIAILKDYLELIATDEESDPATEDLTQKIPENYISYIQTGGSSEDKHFANLKTLFPRAFNHLEGLDTDPRTRILKDFKNLFTSQPLLTTGISLETSGRKYLRYSTLDEVNTDRFSNEISGISSRSTARWLDSKKNLAFELILNLNEDRTIDGKIKLVLGPTNPEYEKRSKLAHAVMGGAAMENPRSLNAKSWTLLNLEKGKWKNFKNMKAEAVPAWIEKEFLPLGIKWKNEINSRLDSFFKSEASN
jgi:hypothetical protein